MLLKGLVLGLSGGGWATGLGLGQKMRSETESKWGLSCES